MKSLRRSKDAVAAFPPGATGRFLLTQMASVAELEAGLISERTKAALAAAKARGVKLGNPNGARALKGKQVGNKQAVVAVKANAERRAQNLRAIMDDLRAQGITSVRAVAAALNDRDILTPRGGAWFFLILRPSSLVLARDE